jgi:hypothetical protein
MTEQADSHVLWGQFRTLCADSLFSKAEQLQKILEYLILAEEQKRKIQASDIVRAIPPASGKCSHGPVGDSVADCEDCAANMRALLSDIRRKLREYYALCEPVKNPVIIEMKTGVVRATYRLREDVDQSAIPQTTSDRHKALIGSWHGKGADTWAENNLPLFSFEVTAQFRVDGLKVRGDFTIKGLESPTHELVSLALQGKFYDDSIIQTSYEALASGRKQAGVALLRLSGDATTLYVCYSSFSPIRDRLVTGSLVLGKG